MRALTPARNQLYSALAMDHAAQMVEQQLSAHASAGGPGVQETRWRGASRALSSMASWAAPIGSATSDMPAHEQRTLRARSRDALRSQMIARAALTRCRTNIVGTGLMCRPSVDYATLGITAEEAEILNAQLRTAWERWAETPAECDIEATFDFYGLQSLALLSAMVSGDVFGITPQKRRPGGVTELKLQLVEADRVSNPNDATDTESMIDGVHINDAMPVGYWVRNQHPGDRTTARMPAWTYYQAFGAETGRRRVLHIWNDKERPGQARGVPYLAPILEPLKQLERYGNAELMAAVLSGLLTFFIEKDKESYDENGQPLSPLSADGPGFQLGNGAVVDLAPGEKINMSAPGRPSANFDPFFVAVVKQIGAALELPLDELLLHYQSSYSAARAAMLQAWRFYTARRWCLTQQLCQPIYGLFLDEEVASGRIRLPGYGDPLRRHAYSKALWIGPARGAMDELKEAQAAKTRIEAGVSNEAIETASMQGEDWDSVHAQRAREVRVRKAAGTWIPPKGTEPVPADDATDKPDAGGVKETAA